MDIYNSYTANIKAAISNDKKSRKSFAAAPEQFQKAELTRLLTESRQSAPLQSLTSVVNELGLQPNYHQKLGLHPDFSYLKNTDQIEKHYIISMFIDIKGSTNLFRRYDPETVLVITNTIQRAAIHTCMIFGGYIHRLHGDGMFVYFGGKSQTMPESANNSLTAAAFFSYFVKNDIKTLFHEQGIETIFTRIGIDLGYAEDVVWAMAGVGEVSEVTTCSLHTSLAAKMQANAESNGVVIGDNIKAVLPAVQFTPVCKRTGNQNDRYIFANPTDGFYYTQYDFDWLPYLKRLDYISTDPFSGTMRMKKSSSPGILSNGLRSIAAANTPYFKE